MKNEHLYREWNIEDWKIGFEEVSKLAQTEFELNRVFKKEDSKVKELIKVIDKESEDVVLEVLKSMLGCEFEVSFGQLNATKVKILDVVDLDNIVLRLSNENTFLEFVNIKELKYYVVNSISYSNK